jgi:hypothetical protein
VSRPRREANSRRSRECAPLSNGHFIRVLASSWLGIAPQIHSRNFFLSTASLSAALGYDQELSRPVIQLWNETRHVEQNEVTP